MASIGNRPTPRMRAGWKATSRSSTQKRWVRRKFPLEPAVRRVARRPRRPRRALRPRARRPASDLVWPMRATGRPSCSNPLSAGSLRDLGERCLAAVRALEERKAAEGMEAIGVHPLLDVDPEVLEIFSKKTKFRFIPPRPDFGIVALLQKSQGIVLERHEGHLARVAGDPGLRTRPHPLFGCPAAGFICQVDIE